MLVRSFRALLAFGIATCPASVAAPGGSSDERKHHSRTAGRGRKPLGANPHKLACPDVNVPKRLDRGVASTGALSVR
jgi:hypothetical protein